MTSRGDFFAHVLGNIGADPNNREAMIALLAQAAGENTGAECNPLATTEWVNGAVAWNTFGDHGQYHVWSYATMADGVGATARTIRNGYYPAWVAGLCSSGRSADEIVRQASGDLDKWGTGGGLVGGLVSQVRASFDVQYAELVPGNGTLDPIGPMPGAPPPLPPSMPCANPYPGMLMAQGSRGPTVGEVREACYRAGFDPHVNDNGDHDYFGAFLDSAVRDFQAANVDLTGVPLEVDGVVGPLTWGALFGCV